MWMFALLAITIHRVVGLEILLELTWLMFAMVEYDVICSPMFVIFVMNFFDEKKTKIQTMETCGIGVLALTHARYLREQLAIVALVM